MIVSETYEVEDCLKYISSASKTFSSSSTDWYSLADLTSNLGNCEITCKMKSSTNKGFRIDLSSSNQYENKNRGSIGVDGSGYKFIAEYDASGTSNMQYPQQAYTQNTDLNCIISKTSSLDLTIDNFHYSFASLSNLRYLGIVNWNNAKTVTITDLKVKPL